jgi:hypothetical protein
MEANDPLKKMPSTAANATRRWAKVELLSWIHRTAQSAFFLIQGTIACQEMKLYRTCEPTSLNGIKKVCALSLLLDVCVDQKGICLRVDVLHHDLETVEATSLGNLDFTTEALDKVLVDNSVGCSEERKDVGNEVSLVVIESIVPVVKVL